MNYVQTQSVASHPSIFREGAGMGKKQLKRGTFLKNLLKYLPCRNFILMCKGETSANIESVGVDRPFRE